MSPPDEITVHRDMTGISPLTDAQLALLDRYLADDCSNDDREAAMALLAARPDLAERVGAIRHALTITGSHIPDASASWTTFRASMSVTVPAHDVAARDSAPSRSVAGVVPPSPLHTVSRWLGRIAVPCLLLGMGVFLYQRHRSAFPPSTSHTYTTRSGMMETVVLADGSRVTLAPRTVLTVRSAAGNAAYDVALVGEAHFDIAPNAHAPFVVHAGSVTTRVLGTAFSVRRYAGETTGQVIVSSGKVSTRAGHVSITLTAGMMARFTDSVVTPTTATPGMYTDWAQGQLVFRDEPVPVMLEALKRWYGYDFRLADSTLALRHVSAEFPIGETSQMLQFVKHLLGVNLVFDDSVVTLHSVREGATPAPRRDKIRIHTSSVLEVGR